MTRTDATLVEDAVPTMKRANPGLSPSDLASHIGRSTDRVEAVVAE